MDVSGIGSDSAFCTGFDVSQTEVNHCSHNDGSNNGTATEIEHNRSRVHGEAQDDERRNVPLREGQCNGWNNEAVEISGHHETEHGNEDDNGLVNLDTEGDGGETGSTGHSTGTNRCEDVASRSAAGGADGRRDTDQQSEVSGEPTQSGIDVMSVLENEFGLERGNEAMVGKNNSSKFILVGGQSNGMDGSAEVQPINGESTTQHVNRNGTETCEVSCARDGTGDTHKIVQRNSLCPRYGRS